MWAGSYCYGVSHAAASTKVWYPISTSILFDLGLLYSVYGITLREGVLPSTGSGTILIPTDWVSIAINFGTCYRPYMQPQCVTRSIQIFAR